MGPPPLGFMDNVHVRHDLRHGRGTLFKHGPCILMPSKCCHSQSLPPGSTILGYLISLVASRWHQSQVHRIPLSVFFQPSLSRLRSLLCSGMRDSFRSFDLAFCSFWVTCTFPSSFRRNRCVVFQITWQNWHILEAKLGVGEGVCVRAGWGGRLSSQLLWEVS